MTFFGVPLDERTVDNINEEQKAEQPQPRSRRLLVEKRYNQLFEDPCFVFYQKVKKYEVITRTYFTSLHTWTK